MLPLALAVLWPAAAGAGEHWRLRYFYDPQDGSEFQIADLAFPSAQGGMAAGEIETEGRSKPYAVATTDGGKTWLPIRIPEPALSLFFLNERTGWLVSRKNIWRTRDFGREWRKLKRVPGALRVYFRDELRGWVVGENKSVLETADGGLTWHAVEAAGKPKAAREDTVYSVIAFAGPTIGMIAGWSNPPGSEQWTVPDWVAPESAPREWPGLTISLITQDGGADWKTSSATMLGRITRLSLTPDGRGLLLFEFLGRLSYPSEVYRVELPGGNAIRVFRRTDRVVTDVLAQAHGPAYLAAIEPSGTLARSPVPGKLKILQSKDLSEWTEMGVDYRAVARRARLAASDPGHVWVATDTGMILQLDSE
jgi:hypothetical protein